MCMEKFPQATLVGALLWVTGCDSMGEPKAALNLCLVSAREPTQLETEVQKFVEHVRGAGAGWDVAVSGINCSNLPPAIYERLEADGRFIRGDGYEIIRASAGALETELRDIYPYVDAIWGLGIAYVLALDSDYPDALLRYEPLSTPLLKQAIEGKRAMGLDQSKLFLDQEYMDGRQQCESSGQTNCGPLYFGITAYQNVVCLNFEKLAGTAWEGRTELTWEELLGIGAEADSEAAELAARVMFPRMDTSGTGLIAGFALIEHLGGSAQNALKAVEYLFEFANRIPDRSTFTPSGRNPCELAADDANPQVAVGVSSDAAFRVLLDQHLSDPNSDRLFPLRPVKITGGVGFEIEALALVARDDYSGTTLDRYLATQFLDWASSPEMMDVYAVTSSVVGYPLIHNTVSEVCLDARGCEGDWSRLNYSWIPNGKILFQNDFRAKVCGLPKACAD